MPYGSDLALANYGYPPSKFIRQLGAIDETSHFFAKGSAESNGLTFDCEFEVAYTYDSKIVVIVYTKFAPDLKKDALLTLVGAGLRRFESGKVQEQISVFEVRLNSVLVGRFRDDDYRETVFSCFASRYFVNSGEEAAFLYFSSPDDIQYFLTGLPRLSPSRWDKKDEAITTLEFEAIPFVLSFPTSFHLYPNQANAVLGFKFSETPKLPRGWDLDDLVDVYCAFLSLAIGRDVQWVEKRFWVMAPDIIPDGPYAREYVYSGEQYTWISRRKIYGQQTTHPFIVDIGHELSEKASDALGVFLKDIMHSAMQLDVTAVRAYVTAIRHFMEYLFVTERREDQARLVTTSIEELLNKWHEHTRTKPKKKFGDRFNTLFANYSMNVGGIEAKTIEVIMTTFIDTRNNIVHEGEFMESTPHKQVEEYHNMLLVLPLIVFRIFNYNGNFNSKFGP